MDDRKIAPKMRCDELLGLATGFQSAPRSDQPVRPVSRYKNWPREIRGHTDFEDLLYRAAGAAVAATDVAAASANIRW